MARLSAALAAAARALGGSYASVLFGHQPWVGALLAAATFVRPATGLCGLAAVVAANLTAWGLGYRPDAIRAGYYGYNGLLVGLAAAAGRALDPRLVLLVALAGAASCLVTAVLGDLLARGAHLPVLALPFVVLASALAPALEHLPVASAGLSAPLVAFAPALPWPIDEALRGLGALVFAPTPLVGLIVLTAALLRSRVATLAALAGLAVAIATGALLGSAPGSTARLAEAYNGALTGLAVGACFFVPSRTSLLVGMAAAMLAAWLAAAMVVLSARLGLPVLAWPFVLATLVTVRALHLRAPDRPPYPSPLPLLGPEANVEYAQAMSRRFGLPGPPQLALPFAGTWTITQGVDGAHTHQDAWADALDFEVTDARGFPFRGDGVQAEAHFCFGLPVLAPAAATVVAVHDGAPDGQPGEQDLTRPWGNAVVLHAGEDLFVVLAHLRCGSIEVRPGQVVAVGQLLGACGASGRSPRPHLHLQVQRTPELGAPALPFRLVHYVVEEARGARRYVHVGTPREGERLARPTPSPIADAFALLPPGLELTLARAAHAPVRLRSEITLLGERYLHDLDRGDRLYFSVIDRNLTFTAHTGGSSAPLRALFRALPRLPSVAGAAVSFEDCPPARSLLSWPARLAHETLRALADPVETRACLELVEEAGALIVRSQVATGWRGRLRGRFRGRVELDAEGLRSIELVDERAPARPSFSARRAS